MIFLRDLGKWHLGTARHICLFTKDKKSTVVHVQTSRIKGEFCTSLLNLQRVFNTQLRCFARTKKESSQCTNCRCQFPINPFPSTESNASIQFSSSHQPFIKFIIPCSHSIPPSTSLDRTAVKSKSRIGPVFALPPLAMRNRYLSPLLDLLALPSLRHNQAQDTILHASFDSLLDDRLREGERTMEVSDQTLGKQDPVLRLQLLGTSSSGIVFMALMMRVH